MKIEQLNEENKEIWNKFVNKLERPLLAYSLKYKGAVEKTYKNNKPYYYIIFENKEPIAIFPLFLIKSRIFKDRIIGTSFLNVGGFTGQINKEIIENLIIELRKIKDCPVKIKTSSIYFNDNIKKAFLDNGFSEQETEKEGFILELKNIEELWEKFHKHTRNSIRKAEKSGLFIQEIENDGELKKFYKIYKKSMKDFGTPHHSFKFFENLKKELEKEFFGLNCYYKNKHVGSLIMLSYKNYSYVAFNVSNPKYNVFKINDFLYWEAIKRAFSKDIKYFDVGLADKNAREGTHAYGLYKFKEKWLGDRYDSFFLCYPRIESHKRKDKYKKYGKIWKIIPSFLTNIIGPKICSQIGI